MEKITFTRVRSNLPKMEEAASGQGIRYLVTKHDKPRLVILGWEDYRSLVTQDKDKDKGLLEDIIGCESVILPPPRIKS